MSNLKGQDDSTAIIIVGLIVVGVIVLYLYFQNAGTLSLPGFLQSNQIVYSDDVVQVIDRFISDQTLYEGQKTTVEFIVVNNGPKDVKGVEVKLDPPTGLTSTVTCGDKGSCKFDLARGEPVDVLITLTAAEGVTQITTADVHYSVSYSYDGEREFKMPIINSKNPPVGQEFAASSNTYGPIHLEFTPPTARPISGRAPAIYAYSDIPFDMSFSVQHVGGAFGFGSTEPILMSGDQLKIDRLDGFDLVRCDKIDTDTKSLVDFNTTSNRLRASAGFEVPFEFECTFQPNKKDEFYHGAIGFKFNYPYKMAFSDTFTILPKGDKGAEEAATSSDSAGGTDPTFIGPPVGSSGPIVITGPISSGTFVTDVPVSTDKTSYVSGEQIKVSGKISPPSSGVTVTLKLMDSLGNLVTIAQPSTDSSGSFSATLAVSPALSKNKGTWKILATAPNGLNNEVAITVS